MAVRDFVAEARCRVVAVIGQVDDASRRKLDAAARNGEIAKWRGYWYPVAGAPFGIGPLKTCYGPVGSPDRWAGFESVTEG